MTILNGADTGPLAGWEIVLVQGHSLIGLCSHAGRMSPAYELHCEMQMIQTDPRRPPQLVTMRRVVPLLTYPSLKSVEVPPGGVRIPISDLSDKERRDLAQSVESCEQLMTAMRAGESGITIAPASVLK